MNQWEEYKKSLKKQKIDVKEIRQNNLKIWAENHPFNKDKIEKSTIKKIQDFYKSNSRLLYARTATEANEMGAVLIAKGIIQLSQVLTLDYNWLALNFYNYDNKDVLTLKEKLYDKKYKIFFVYNWPVSNSLSALNDKNAEMTRNIIAEQYRIRDDLKIVVQSADESSKDIFIDFIRGTIDNKNKIQGLEFYD